MQPVCDAYQFRGGALAATMKRSGDTDALVSGVSDEGAEPPLDLNVFDREDQGLLRNLLAANDGACLVDADGRLRRFKAKLKVRFAEVWKLGKHCFDPAPESAPTVTAARDVANSLSGMFLTELPPGVINVSNVRAVAPDVVEVEYERSDITKRLGLRVRIESAGGDASEEAGRIYEEDLGEPLGSALEELELDDAGRHWWESSQSKWSG